MAVGRDAITNAQQFALAVVFLPHQAVVSADAIIRTLYRLFISHRNLLEWQTASQVERALGIGSQLETWRKMWPVTTLCVALGSAIGLHVTIGPAGRTVILLLFVLLLLAFVLHRLGLPTDTVTLRPL